MEKAGRFCAVAVKDAFAGLRKDYRSWDGEGEGYTGEAISLELCDWT